MSNGGAAASGAAASGAAAAAAAIAQATKASGAIVSVEPSEFVKILNRMEAPLVVTAAGGVFTKKHQYLTNYKGLYFFTQSVEPIHGPARTEYVTSKKIWIP